MNRIPSFIQIAMVEMLGFTLLGLGFFHRIFLSFGLYGDHGGAFNYSSPPPPFDAGSIGSSLVGAFFMWLTFREIWRPRFKTASAAPVRHIGPVSVVLPNDPWAVNTYIITSHPAYVLIDLFAGALPILFLAATWEEDIAYCPIIYGWWWALGLWAMIPVARLFCWYVLGRGPDIMALATKGSSPAQVRRLSWDLAWSPALLVWQIALPIVAIALIGAFLADRKHPGDEKPNDFGEAPNATLLDGKRFRIEATLKSGIHMWPRIVTAHKDSCAGMIVDISGTNYLLLVEGSNVKRMLRSVEGGAGAKPGTPLKCYARVMEPPSLGGAGGRRNPPTGQHYFKYQNFVLDFPINHGTPNGAFMLLWVDP